MPAHQFQRSPCRRNGRNQVVGLGLALIFAGCLVVSGCTAPKRVYRRPPDTDTAVDRDSRPAAGRSEPSGSEAGTGEDTGPGFSEVGLSAAMLATEQIGRPYLYGGESPNGFDCSGLVQYVYGQLDIILPRTVERQVRVGRSVERYRVEPGDLVFFRVDGDRISHVGIYTGGDLFVHAPSSGGRVCSQSLKDSWWNPRLAAIRRVH